MQLTAATCQFPVSADIRRNLAYIKRQVHAAKEGGAEVVHFPEGSLSGYAGIDFASHEGFNWSLLKQCVQEILNLAGERRIWVVLGSSHRLSGRHKPHNSLYIINDQGKLVDRYDKLFCAGDRSETSEELEHYTPGNYFCVFTIRGVRCGALICHEYRYPELYREYKRRGVQLMFHSFHAGNMPAKRWQEMREYVGVHLAPINPGTTIPGITMPAAMHSASANNYMWISCSNSSARQSCWPAFFVRPDGVKTGRLRRNVTGVLLSTVDTGKQWYDSTKAWRNRVMEGVFHSGTLVEDARSRNRTEL
jgi:predicted amidohydrolase